MAAPNNPAAPAQAPVPVMAMPIQVLTDHFQRLENELRAQSISRDSKTYSGEGTKRLKEWVKEMDKYDRIVNGDQARMRTFAIMTLTGIAGDYLSRMLHQHPQANWNQIKDSVVTRFSDLADQHYALRKLKQIKQGTGEAVQAYGERLLSLAEDAYPGQPANQPVLQRELIDIYIEGLKEDFIVRKLLRNRPQDIYAAIETAMEEQQVSRVFKAQRRGEEPMDVDVVDKQLPFMKAVGDKLDVLASSIVQLVDQQKETQRLHNQTRPNNSNNQGQQNPRNIRDSHSGMRSQYTRPKPKFEYTHDGKPICNYCKQVNHILRDCQKRQADQQRIGNNRPMLNRKPTSGN